MRQRKRLSAVLVARHLRHNLRRHVASRKETVGLLNQRLTDYRPVLEHIGKVNQITVMLLLGKIIGIMKMNDSFFVCIHNLCRKQHSLRQILADFPRHIIPLGRINHRVLIRILLRDLLVNILYQGKYPVIRRIRLTLQLPSVTVTHILLCHFITAHLHNSALNHILNIFYIHSMGQLPYL